MIGYVLSIVVVFVSSVVNGFPERYVGEKTSENHYPFKLYKRQEWGAEPATKIVPLNTPVPYVVIHHTYIPAACNTTEDCMAGMRSMQRYHNSQDWGDIGYNFCIGSEAGVYEGRGWQTKGIHAGRANGVSVGICLIGDWRTELPPQDQLEAAKELIKAGIKEGYISPDYKLVGHRQVMNTECPGGALYQHISTWDHFMPKFEEVKN
ncbi:peptidoglycan-recognition protein LB-like [Ostrinia nubilalis]|uniref:peptidoglycan-recognition protein LB-like n=1 Tax=Ostrinia nubilalis TaxID=29057 RepID=UPI00308242CD